MNSKSIIAAITAITLCSCSSTASTGKSGECSARSGSKFGRLLDAKTVGLPARSDRPMYYFRGDEFQILFSQADAVRFLRVQNADVGLEGLLPVLERQPQLLNDEDIMSLAREDQRMAFSLLRLAAGMVEGGLAAIVEAASGGQSWLDRVEVRSVENPNGDFRYFCSPGKKLLFKVIDEYS